MDELQSGERKRSAAGEGERPSKRRRLGQASILCMRELFRTVVNDGDISEDKRILLQNAGVLLSQVDGKTWVSFPDTQGELQELTPQQLRVLRPFFDQVAEELKMREVQLLSDSTTSAGSGDHLDCLKLTHVPWADGITARELIACCSPDEALQFNTRWNWLEVLIRILPSKYMLKSRMKELVNYYYIQSLTPEAVTAATPKNNIQKEDKSPKKRKIPTRAVALVVQRARLCLQISRSAARFMSGLVTKLVLLAAQTLAAVFGRMMQHLPFRDDPAWPLARLFFAVLLQGQIKKFLELIVLIARLRVILCLARSSEIFGFLFFPFVVIAQKVLGWNEGSWLLGCPCDISSRPSLLSYFPVRAAEGLLACLKAIRHLQTFPGLAMLGVVVDPFIDAVIWIQPAVVFLSDLMFSVGFAEGLAMIVRSVDKSAHHKLVWMSMNVGRMLREGPAVNPMELGEQRAEQSVSAQVADSPQPLPEWREDGTWNLFDGGD